MAQENVPLSRVRGSFELYARNFIHITTKAGTLVPLVLNAPQQKLHRAVEWQESRDLPVRIVLLKSRQFGGSTYAQARAFWRSHMNPNRTAITLAHKDESAAKLFEMQRTFYDNLPLSGPLSVEKKIHNRKQISFKGTRSSTRVVSVGKGSGRGFTCQDLHGSEVAFWEDAARTMTAVKQAVPKLPGTSVILESTPNGFGGEFHEAYLDAKSGKSDYIAVFVAWFEDPTCSMKAKITEADLQSHPEDEYGDERGLKDEFGLSLDQLEWRRNTIVNECSGDIERFIQEYPSDDQSCFLVSGRPVFNKRGLDYQLNNTVPMIDSATLPPPAEVERDHEGRDDESGAPMLYLPDRRLAVVRAPRGRLRLYELPVRRVMYVAAADCSEGDPGSDPSPVVILNRMKLSLAAILWCRMPPDLLAKYAIALAWFYNESQLIWEANNQGITFGQTVQEQEYGNVYLRRTSEDSVALKSSDKMGYWSGTRTKMNAVNTLRTYIRDAPDKQYPPLVDPHICHELPAWIFDGELALVPDGSRGYEGQVHHGDASYALAMALVAHRGSMESPLEPIPLDEVRAARGDLLARFGPGHRARPEDLMGRGEVTCEDLEMFDEMEESIARAERAFGIGRMR
jgi:hypothetical protein